MDIKEKFLELSKKILADDVVMIRRARGGQNPPLIVSVPKSVAKAAKFIEGLKVRIFTDGENVYLQKLGEPRL
jgi:hypothetical protein